MIQEALCKLLLKVVFRDNLIVSVLVLQKKNSNDDKWVSELLDFF